MYEYIKGQIAELNPAYVVLDVSGVGYQANISLTTYADIEGNDPADITKLFVHYIVREDAQLFFGFSTKSERELFRMLISVSGVGGNTARMILSTYSPKELQSIIMTENAALLKCVKGLGLKTAQKIIVDLSGKMLSMDFSADYGDSDITETAEAFTAKNTIQNEATEALVMLGFTKGACQKTVNDITAENPSLGVEEIIRLALKKL
ncbi:MAG: Holliday junction branch migration protein RuvA [Rikenellaceae bacterium]